MKSNSPCKTVTYGLVVHTLEDVKLIRYILFIARKRIILKIFIHI